VRCLSDIIYKNIWYLDLLFLQLIRCSQHNQRHRYQSTNPCNSRCSMLIYLEWG